MFNRESILKSLNSENYYIDKHSLDLFLEDWKIESIYEDEEGLEFYDDMALEKIRKGISLKAQGYSDEQIITKLHKIQTPSTPVLTQQDFNVQADNEEITNSPIDIAHNITPVKTVESVEPVEAAEIITEKEKSFTLDVTSQTLQMLAEAVAKKISDDITNSEWTEKLIEAGGYKRDNEILAKQVKELLEHNKELSSRIEQLESRVSVSFWDRFKRKRI